MLPCVSGFSFLRAFYQRGAEVFVSFPLSLSRGILYSTSVKTEKPGYLVFSPTFVVLLFLALSLFCLSLAPEWPELFHRDGLTCPEGNVRKTDVFLRT